MTAEGKKSAFDADLWWKECEKFRRNKEGLECSEVLIKRAKNGHIFFRIEGVDDRYQKPLRQLAVQCLGGLSQYFMHSISADYATDEDRTEQLKQQCYLFRDHNAEFCWTLLNKGVEAAVDLCNARLAMLRITYEAPRFTYRHGTWFNPRGEEMDDGFYMNEHVEGGRYSCASSRFWSEQLIPGYREKLLEEQKHLFHLADEEGVADSVSVA